MRRHPAWSTATFPSTALVVPVEGLPEITAGADLAGLIAEAATSLADGDILASERANRASDSTPDRRGSVFTRRLPLVLWAAATTSSVEPWALPLPPLVMATHAAQRS